MTDSSSQPTQRRIPHCPSCGEAADPRFQYHGFKMCEGCWPSEDAGDEYVRKLDIRIAKRLQPHDPSRCVHCGGEPFVESPIGQAPQIVRDALAASEQSEKKWFVERVARHEAETERDAFKIELVKLNQRHAEVMNELAAEFGRQIETLTSERDHWHEAFDKWHAECDRLRANLRAKESLGLPAVTVGNMRNQDELVEKLVTMSEELHQSDKPLANMVIRLATALVQRNPTAGGKNRHVLAFTLNVKQTNAAFEWMSARPEYDAGAVGGCFTFCFTKTSIGFITKLKDSRTDEVVDLTDYGDM